MFPGEEYPPPFNPEEHMEPVGELYPKFKEWDKIDRKLAEFKVAGMEPASEATTVKLVPNLKPNPYTQPSAPASTAKPAAKSTDKESRVPCGGSFASHFNEPEPVLVVAESERPDSGSGSENAPTTTPANTVPATAAAVSQQPSSTSAPSFASPSSLDCMPFSLDDAEPTFSPADAESSIQEFLASVPPVMSKRKRTEDNGFGAKRWGNRKGGNATVTLDNSYLTGPRLAPVVHNALYAAVKHVYGIHGSQSLQPNKLHTEVAELFNSWHIELASKDGHGYGGKIQVARVSKFFSDEGNKIKLGKMGVRPIPYYATLPPPQQPVGYAICKPAPVRLLSAAMISSMSQPKLRKECKAVGLSTNGLNDELRKRLKRHYNV